jgi:hypothetical protein
LKDFKEMVLDRAAHNSFCWFRYVNGTLIVWSHGPDRLRHLPEELSNVHQNIQFTMETERDGHLSFLDPDITGNPMALWAIKCTVVLPIVTST